MKCMLKRTMRVICGVGLVLLIAGCATAPAGTPMGVMPERPSAIDVSGEDIDSLLYLGVELRVAGATLGGHYDGLAKVYQWPVEVGPEVEETWSRWMTESGVEMLRAAGYSVKEASRIFGRSQSHADVGYALAGQATNVEVNTYGALAGGKTEVSLQIDWELFDTDSRDVVYSRSFGAAAATAGTSGDPIQVAFESIFAKLLADSTFVDAIRPSAPMVVSGKAYADVNWRRPVPGETEIVSLAAPDLNPIAAGTVFERVADAVVSLQGNRGHGTAFLISKDGLALTNHHVVDGQQRLVARFRGGHELPARVLRSNEAADVALVQIACVRDCSTVRLANTVEAAVGADVLVIGTPLTEELNHTLTKGVVSGIRLSSGVTLVQTDAAVNRGNSGGPIVGANEGEVLAVTSSKLVGPDVEGIGFGISITDALRVLGIRYTATE